MLPRSVLVRVFLIVLCVLLPSGAAMADQQVNQPDNNSSSSDDNTTESETSAAAFGNTVVVGWNDSRQFANGIGAVTSMTGFGYSTDGGNTFVDAGQLAPAPGNINLGDPALAVDGSGNFYFASLSVNSLYTLGSSRIAVSKSTSISPTVTFGTPVLIPGLLTTSSAFQDKEFIAVDSSGGAFDGRVYVAWSEFASQFDSTPKILFARSTSTSPLAFATPVALSPTDALNHGAMPAVGPNGEVYVVWGRFIFGGSTESIHLLKSTDGGVTFVNPDPMDPNPNKTIANPTPAPDSMSSGGEAPRTRGHPYIAVDHTPAGSLTRGNLYVVYQADPDGSGPDRSDIFFQRSTDGGRSWSAARSVNAGPAVTGGGDTTTNDNWQPSIAVSPTNGQITVTFYDRREDPANTGIKIYRAISTDGGLTWADSPVSSTAFAPNVGYDPALNPSYMGDYNYAVADGNVFHITWGDLRNVCTPPAGATAPCSPAGRPDMDVFYSRESQLTGPDLAITPWGHITGVGPEWKSPDIFVLDGVGMETNAVKGQTNHLRARVRNLGNAPASSVTVRFKFAPWFAGISDSAFKEIGTATVNFAAVGDPSGDDTHIVPIEWDLSDLTDTNGGTWPMPISSFAHFCVKVSVEFTGDANPANNIAQTNFFDVPTVGTGAPLMFLVGNPSDKEERAQLDVTGLPPGYSAELLEGPAPFGKPFALKPNEIRVAVVQFTAPPETANNPPSQDVVANINLQVGGNVVGGISARLFKAEGSHLRNFDAPCDRVFEAIKAVLKAGKEPVSLADPQRGLINTGSIDVDRDTLLQYVVPDAARELERAPQELSVKGATAGRYLLSFRIRCLDEKTTQVEVNSLIVASQTAESPIGGPPIPSNGKLEEAHLDAIGRVVTGSGSAAPLATPIATPEP
jgi:hypothetical protein